MGSLAHKDCIRCFCSVWDNPQKHVRACAFGVQNMARGMFEGTQDRLGDSRLQELWGELGMDKLRQQCVSEVDEMFDRGQLPWSTDTIHLLVEEYPKRGCLDVYRQGQEDEGDCDANGGYPDDHGEQRGSRGAGRGQLRLEA